MAAGLTKRVALPGLDTSKNEDGVRRFLEKTALDQDIEVLVNPSNTTRTTISGEVHFKNADLTSTILIEGVAAYAPTKEPYTVSAATECRYRNEELRARQERRGIWK